MSAELTNGQSRNGHQSNAKLLKVTAADFDEIAGRQRKERGESSHRYGR